MALHETSATIVESTSVVGSPTLVPQALMMSGDACTLPGGAVLAADTLALVGLVRTSDRTINCMYGTGSPVAVRIAPFRQFLLETARAAETQLVAERRAGEARSVPECDAQPRVAR